MPCKVKCLCLSLLNDMSVPQNCSLTRLRQTPGPQPVRPSKYKKHHLSFFHNSILMQFHGGLFPLEAVKYKAPSQNYSSGLFELSTLDYFLRKFMLAFI